MALDRNSFNLFGFDLLRLPDDWRQGWSEALRWRPLARLFPSEPVRLLLPDGTQSTWPRAAEPARASALAVVLPDELVLRRQLKLPPLSHAEQLQAVELALQAASPFPLERIVWGYHAAATDSGATVELALAAKDHVSSHLERMFSLGGPADPERAQQVFEGAGRAPAIDAGLRGERPSLEADVGPAVASPSGAPVRPVDAGIEVWTSGEPPVVLQGFGEIRRLARERRFRWKVLGLLALCTTLLVLLAASPVVHKRQQVLEFNAQLDALTGEVAPVVADRDALGKTNLQLQAVAAYAQARPDPLVVLGRLSALLPDTVHLTRLDLRGRTVTIGGLAENAAGLMETLGAQPDFHDVRAPSAITRDRISGRESFSIEFKLADGVSPR